MVLRLSTYLLSTGHIAQFDDSIFQLLFPQNGHQGDAGLLTVLQLSQKLGVLLIQYLSLRVSKRESNLMHDDQNQRTQSFSYSHPCSHLNSCIPQLSCQSESLVQKVLLCRGHQNLRFCGADFLCRHLQSDRP